MKILLIQLYDENVPVYPIGLAYIATALNGHDVKVFDQNTCRGNPFSETEQIVNEFCPDVVGFSLRNLCFFSKRDRRWKYYYEQLTPTIKAIRKARKESVIVAGGAGFSMFPEEIMKNETGIDYGVYLEGENSFRDLIENIEAPHKVGGIFIRDGEKIALSGNSARPDFGSMEAPKRDFVNPQLYDKQYAIGIQSKRGCILNCIYCNYPSISGNQLRMRSAAKVVDEIEYLQSLYGFQEFAFVDNVFNVPLSHATEICREIIDRKLSVQWTAWFNERFMDKDFVDLAVEAGCRTFEFSPDGYSNRSLKWLNKNIQTRHIINAYKLLKNKPDIDVRYHFMIGIPGQDIFSLMRLAFFAARLKIFFGKRLKRLHFNWLYISPNTEAQKLAIKNKIINRDADLMKLTRYESGITRLLFKILSPVSKFINRLKPLF